MSSAQKPVFHDPDGRRARRVNLAIAAMTFGVVVVFAGVAAGFMFAPRLPHLALDTAKADLSSKAEQDVDSPAVHGLVAGRSRQVPRSALTAMRYGFFTSGDPSSFIALRRHAEQLDAIIPDWLLLVQSATGVELGDEEDAKKVRHWLKGNASHVRVYPRLDNGMPPAKTTALLATAKERRRAAKGIAEYLRTNDDAGIVVDLRGLPLSANASLAAFLRLLVTMLRPQGRQVILALDAGAAVPRSQPLVDAVDYVLLDTYQGFGREKPGPIVAQGWLESQIAAPFAARNRRKIIFGIGSYGHDWDALGRKREIAVQTAWDTLGASQATLRFSAPSLNPHFSYEDNGSQHQVWFLDAVTAYNQAKSALALRPAGIAVWRLGMEDPGIWNVLGRGRLPDQSALAQLRDPVPGNDTYSKTAGEIFDFRATARNGSRKISYNEALGLIVRQSLTVLPKQAALSTPKIVDKKLIALTFDDGPDPRYTPAILDILAERGAKATFFVIGKNAVAYPQLLKRIFDEGHDIANHTYTHRDLLGNRDAPVEFELNATQRVFESVLGRHTMYFRPAYASRHILNEIEAPYVIETAAQLGYLTVSANIDPFDWVTTTATQIARRTIDQTDSEIGQVVLLHDSGGNRKPTIGALPHIIDGLRERGYELAPLHQLLGMSRDAAMPKVVTTRALTRVGQSMRTAWYGILRTIDRIVPVVVIGATVLGALRLGLIVLGAHVHDRRERRRRNAAGRPASLAVLVPAYNEEKVICRTVQSLIDSNLDMEFDVVVIDDGSKDGTAEVARSTFAGNSRVKVFKKPNGGKAAALNYALHCIDAEVVVAIDADTILDPDAIGLLVRHFDDPALGAVAGSAMVGNQINLLTRFQAIEYAISQNLDRRAFELFNAISVVPGAIGAWRRKALLQVGGYAGDTLAEDADITVGLERHGWKVIYEPRALARTEAPETLRPFLKQRFRWMFGTLQVAHKNAGAILRNGPLPLALITLPNVYLFQFMFSVVAPLMDAILVWSVATTVMASVQAERFQDIDSLLPLAAYWAFFQLLDLAAAVSALRMDITRSWSLLPLIVLQRFCYRQLLYVVALRSAMAAVKGHFVGWGKLARTGRVQAKPAS